MKNKVRIKHKIRIYELSTNGQGSILGTEYNNEIPIMISDVSWLPEGINSFPDNSGKWIGINGGLVRELFDTSIKELFRCCESEDLSELKFFVDPLNTYNLDDEDIIEFKELVSEDKDFLI